MAYRISSFEEYQSEYQKSIDDPAGFWAGIAENFHWQKKWDTTLEWEFETPINLKKTKKRIADNVIAENKYLF